MRLENREVKLSPRLQMIADMVPKGSKMADIGTDHGYIPIYLVRKGLCPSAVASDVKVGPIQRAEKNVKKYRLQEKIALLICDGIDDKKLAGCDTIVIAGMGGELIREIIKKSSLAKQENMTLLLQPMTGEEELREFLLGSGYSITRECLCKEEKKLYVAIVAVPKKSVSKIAECCPVVFYHIGKQLIDGKDPLLNSYIDKKIAVKKKARLGLELSKDPQKEEKIGQLEQLIDQMESLKTKEDSQ